MIQRTGFALSLLLASSLANASAHRLQNLPLDQLSQNFVFRFWVETKKDFRFFSGDACGADIADYWFSAQALDTVLDWFDRSQDQKAARIAVLFAESGVLETGAYKYYDDENWMALAFLHAYDAFKKPNYLDTARILFDDVWSAWDETCCGENPGGIWWNSMHSQKATASNAGVAITAIRLYQTTKNGRYLRIAQQIYRYWYETMGTFIGNDLCVADHLELDGKKLYPGALTYNDGLMIGAAALLFQATSDPTYLAHAHEFAACIMHRESAETSLGDVMTDQSPPILSCQQSLNEAQKDFPQFKEIAFRYFIELEKTDFNQEETDFLGTNIDNLIHNAWDPTTHFIAPNWEQSFSKFERSFQVLPQQSSGVSALNLFFHQNIQD